MALRALPFIPEKMYMAGVMGARYRLLLWYFLLA
jgi:hypothetical protein